MRMTRSAPRLAVQTAVHSPIIALPIALAIGGRNALYLC
jgi:hypothetical protein